MQRRTLVRGSHVDADGRPSRALARLQEHPEAVVAAAVVLLAIPYFVLGPHFLADDFIWLRNAEVGGWWQAGGPRTAGRPGGWLTAALTFGLIGSHPAVLYVLFTGLRAIAAVCVYRCLTEFMRPAYALTIALVWIVTPNHLSLEFWLSMIAAPIALAFLAYGITQLARACRTGQTRRFVVAYLCLAVSVAIYELTAGVALVAVIVVPYLVGRRPRSWRMTALGAGLVAAPALWAVIRSSVYDHGSTGRLDPAVVFPSHFSLGMAPFGPQGRLVTAVVIVALAWSLSRVARSGVESTGFGERLVLAGTVVVLCGVAPLVSLNTNFFGMNDRLMLVSSVGVAMVWTGVVLIAARLVSRPRVVLALGLVAFVALVLVLRTERTRDFVDAGRETTREIAALSASARSQSTMDVPGPLANVNRVWGLNDGWNATAAVQVALHDQDVTIDTVIYGQLVGPEPSRPDAQF